MIAERKEEQKRTSLNYLFPLGTSVYAFHPRMLSMEAATITGYLGEKPASLYAVVVTFTDSTSHFYYRAYINVHDHTRSLVVRR